MTKSTTTEILRSLGSTYFEGPTYIGIPQQSTFALGFFNASSALGTYFQAGNTTAELTYSWPTAGPSANGQSLVSTTTGAMSWSAMAAASSAFVTIGNDASLTGERALTGTSNQIIIADNGANSTVVLSTPQNIHTAATPTFASETLTATSNQLVLGTTRTVTLTAPTPATSSRTHTIPDVSADASFVMTEGTQTIGGAKTFTASLSVNFSASGSQVDVLSKNTSNTANSHARLLASVGGTSAGDAIIILDIPGGQTWGLGVDNSDSDTFKVSFGGSLGTSDFFTITSGGLVSLGSGSGAVNVRINTTSTTGASLATITNSPVAGNPAAWIQVSINGTDRYIPCW